MNHLSAPLLSVCVYCASSPQARPDLMAAAASLGELIAREKIRLVYGGGSLGLMGACARAAKAAGGEVLGVIPGFLTRIEPPLGGIETVVVASMHERKMRMFEESDGFAVLPGAIGTLEEAIELISWRRLELHDKPIVFFDPGTYWRPILELFERFIADRLVPEDFARCWSVVSSIEEVIPDLRRGARPRPSAQAVEKLS
ncbi:MAG: TIGR00730 family Rossman fold protein [Caulobacteraceae bacterium]